jgi:hypothetical protein
MGKIKGEGKRKRKGEMGRGKVDMVDVKKGNGRSGESTFCVFL